jgi:hypothetical protein
MLSVISLLLFVKKSLSDQVIEHEGNDRIMLLYLRLVCSLPCYMMQHAKQDLILFFYKIELFCVKLLCDINDKIYDTFVYLIISKKLRTQ